MKEVVASGRSVEEAKREALKELGVDSEDGVEIEIIDEGSKGVFGWGTKFARIKVRLLKEVEPKESKKSPIPAAPVRPPAEEKRRVAAAPAPAPQPPASVPNVPLVPAPMTITPVKKESSRTDRQDKRTVRERATMPPITVGERPLPQTPPASRIKKDYNNEVKEDYEDEEYPDERTEEIALGSYEEEQGYELIEEDDEEGDGEFNPRDVLKTVLDLFGVEGEIQIRKTTSGPVYSVDGKDLGVLIGKHGQTLEALQFIINLILMRRTKRKKKITIDVEGYRSRREKSLQDLARRLAEKAKREKRNIVLEPMLPSERRIIHLTLQNNPYISTFSQGEEPMRKVIISPKKRQPARVER